MAINVNLQDDKTLIKERLSKVKKKYIVLSGKGGVGKTTVAVNIAAGFAKSGSKTGIIDLDIHGPNVAKMLGLEGKKTYATEDGIIPMEAYDNLYAISTSFFLQSESSPVIWRGPLKMNAIKQYFKDVVWGDIEYLIMDAPPGTGDEPLSAAQLLPDIDGAIIVSTPQEVSLLDTKKSVEFAKAMNVPITGLIENMSEIICPHCGGRIDIFGSGRVEQLAKDLGLPFLGKIPLNVKLRELGDEGKPIVYEDTEISKTFMDIIEKLK